jgi:2-keto-4-pentenoate hydratase/2-oxohepta-3-ene-1,7-dioic acid hydratase in catechol pathway
VKGKSADTFAPLGPFLATRDEVPNSGRLGMWLTVNGEFRQRSSTAEVIFAVPTLVSYVSESMTLLPNNIISTGTPAGVGMGMKPLGPHKVETVTLKIDDPASPLTKPFIGSEFTKAFDGTGFTYTDEF